ncbi:hypothetical protein CTAYLR_007031 [Chrysophaeum taylorii]|uniref:Methyltransferase domain-containing protein n=1 Tax=Chrysophaeum taylorii TaxID=2483200 RepID=A0AAD7XIG8_9STRA|nr:hypothetical protein CTAYLR_007031 [Chrysophaeum taylorii]
MISSVAWLVVVQSEAFQLRAAKCAKRTGLEASALTAESIRAETDELKVSLRAIATSRVESGAFVERVRHFQRVVGSAAESFDADELRVLQQQFREKTSEFADENEWLERSRTWPEGYAGDYKMLEFVYTGDAAGSATALGDLWTHYLQQCTLAVAVRCRMRRLRSLLTARVDSEPTKGNWLNVACGSCRELLEVPARKNKESKIYCLDNDANALEYARDLLAEAPNADALSFVQKNALRLKNATTTNNVYGPLTTIYSAGLFDYLASRSLVPLIHGLYDALAPGGLLIMPFKDMARYETFDYHWLSEWHYFLQRAEADFVQILADAGIPETSIAMERDDSGAIMFFLAHK